MAGDAAARGPHRSLVQDVMHVVERFAAWADDWRSKPIPPEVLHHAKRAVIDWHAALFPGAVLPPAILLEKALRDELDHGDATLALGRRATVRAAALINGAASHTVEVDDIYRDGIYHPGAPTIPAALALAQAHGASGERWWSATRSRPASAQRWGARTTSTGTTPAPSASSAPAPPPPRSCAWTRN